MTRPTTLADELPTLENGFLGREFPSASSIASNTPDRARDLSLFIPSTGSVTLAQSATGGQPLGGPGTVSLSSNTTLGNTLIFSVATRGSAGDPTTPAGWTAHPDGTASGGGNSLIAMYYKVSDGTETGIAFSPNGGGGWIGGISEWSGVGDLIDSAETTGTTNPLAGASVTPTAGEGAFVIGSFEVNGDAGQSAVATGDWTELHDSRLPASGLSPLLWSAYQVISSASGAYAPAGTCSVNSLDYGAQSLAFAAGTSVNGGSGATDGEDSTYSETSGSEAGRIDLGEARRIVRSRIFIGSQNSGSRTYTIEGANVADFSDAVTLDSTTFTATGSYTGQEVLFSWAFDFAAAYRFFRLTGTNESRRLYSWELYEAGLAETHSHSFGSNATDVSGHNAAGATGLYADAGHVHRGVSSIAHASNTFYGPVTLTTPGDTVGISSPTPGTLAFTAKQSAGGGGGGSEGGSGPEELDYVEKTSSTTITATSEVTGQTIVSSTSLAYDGSTVVLVEFSCAQIAIAGTGGAICVLDLWEDSTPLGRISVPAGPTGYRAPTHGSRRLTPSSGNHQYHIKSWKVVVSGTPVVTVDAGAGGTGALVPAFIRITTVP